MRADLPERALQWAQQRRRRIRGHNPWEVGVRTWREVADDRATGLAAEMAFFALLSFAPLLIAIGAALGYLERLIGTDQVARAETAILETIRVVLSPELTNDVVAPLVQGLLYEERGGIAILGMLGTLWLASRVFTATIRALDLAYDVEERRNMIQQRALAVVFALLSVLVVTLTLAFLVVGPLLGGGHAIAARFGLGDAFSLAWSVGRWPVLLLLLVGFTGMVYRNAPSHAVKWRETLPGAVMAVGLWLLVTLGFRLYLELGAGQSVELAADEAAAAAASMLGAVVAAVLWVYLSSLVLLLGGELNGELAKSRARRFGHTSSP